MPLALRDNHKCLYCLLLAGTTHEALPDPKFEVRSPIFVCHHHDGAPMPHSWIIHSLQIFTTQTQGGPKLQPFGQIPYPRCSHTPVVPALTFNNRIARKLFQETSLLARIEVKVQCLVVPISFAAIMYTRKRGGAPCETRMRYTRDAKTALLSRGGVNGSRACTPGVLTISTRAPRKVTRHTTRTCIPARNGNAKTPKLAIRIVFFFTPADPA